MGVARNSIALAMSLVLVACGGGGGGGSSPPPTGGTNPTPPPPTSTCSLSARQDFVKAVVDEWYLFPDLVDNTVNKANFNNIDGYIDALVAPARAQSRDRFFTYMTSIAEENALINSGSSAGFGIRLAYDTTNNRVFVLESFETGPAFPQGFDRGTELLAIGTTASNLQTVTSLMTAGGPGAVIEALGPSTAGLQRVFRIRDVNGTERQVTVAKADFALDPMSDRYGAKVLDDNGKKVGYINLRTFIVDSAEQDLRAAFEQFRQQGITELIIDYRYNGGGLVRIAELMGDLMAANRVGEVFSRTTLRASKASENETDRVGTQAQAIAATKIAFIGTRSSASASELVANAFIPYLGSNTALVGTNTFGKPVGQFAFDRAECDDRFRVVAFRTENASGQGDYYTGLASVFPNTCRAADDIFTPLGDPREASIAQALAFLRSGASVCSPISANGENAVASAERQRGVSGGREPLTPQRPSPAQREVPGFF
ncbi:S41 family peptidase [Altererythrobacter sp. H2]|uniref:S41 family peptidase n=1 Tax=Altererythrobacter sp. H2 TaxID=3108391 RepID=UPI000BC5085B|nr:S41 family peptidase [Altererythrobacter sp. H2]OZA93969.1 MAG: peptidase S41 [Erythrobacter sp. 34-65-8]WRK96602.1 S41 family peptidase [Altererythrobacter sp. H2]